MAEQNSEQKLSEVIFSWQQPEYLKYKKNIWWYVASAAVLALLVLWAVADGRWFGGRNYLFAIFLILFYLLILLYEIREPEIVDFFITPDGIKFGRKFYPYNELENFFIIYEDRGIKNLYIDFKNPLKGRLIGSLENQDAVAIREFLLAFLKEDLEREIEPISEKFRRWLKL
jgi:hypothetical protein